MNRSLSALIFVGLIVGSARASEPSVSGTVKAEGPPAKGLVVYIEKAAQTATPKPQPLRVEQRDTRFSPPSAVVVQGQTISFPNLDKFYHNVFSVSPGNEFDLGLYRAGGSKDAHLTQPGEVDIYCNIHPDMAARLLVLQNDYYALVGADGTYRISGVPPGRYVLWAWSPQHEPQKQAIEVQAQAGVRAQFTLKLRQESKTHLNKSGEQYGRYR